MKLLANFVSIGLMSLSLCSYLQANPYPVYFADAIIEDGKEILHFEWRPDYKSYDRAVITGHNGEVDYSNLYVSGPAEKITIKKRKGENARFVGAESGKEFIVNGANDPVKDLDDFGKWIPVNCGTLTN